MNTKRRISAIVLTKNEGDRIEDCLRSLNWVDEIIIVDNISTDDTLERAKKYNVRILKMAEPNFSLLREEGAKHAKGEWVLYVDADEKVTEELRKEILDTTSHFDPSNSPRAYFIKRDNSYLGKHWAKSDKMERLFWRSSLKGWQGPLHEAAIVDGFVDELTQYLIHNTHRNLEEMVDKTNRWSQVEAELRLSASHPPVVWWRLIRVMWTGFFNSYIKEQGWKMGTVGIVESVYQAFSLFITYAKLWELQGHK